MVECAGCGEPIGAYERVMIEHRSGRLQAAAAADLEQHELETVDRAWHGGCTVRPRVRGA